MVGGVACGLAICIVWVSKDAVDLVLRADVGRERVFIGREVGRRAVIASALIVQGTLIVDKLSAVSNDQNEKPGAVCLTPSQVLSPVKERPPQSRGQLVCSALHHASDKRLTTTHSSP